MAGIKHGMWSNFMGGETPKAPSGDLEWTKFAMENQVSFCKICGKTMVMDQEMTQWEFENKTHESCFRKNYGHGNYPR